MERSLPAGRNEGALVVLADGCELPQHAGQATVDLAVVALVAKERPDARVGVRDVATLPGLAPGAALGVSKQVKSRTKMASDRSRARPAAGVSKKVRSAAQQSLWQAAALTRRICEKEPSRRKG